MAFALVAMSKYPDHQYQRAINGLSAKGLWGLVSTAFRLLVVGLTYPAHRSVVAAIEQDSTRRVIKIYPRIVYRYTQTYLASNIKRVRRLEMFRGHYEFINNRFDSFLFDQLLDGALVLWSAKRDGHQVSVSLSGPCMRTLHREGDLTLKMHMDGMALYNLAFSIVPTASLELDCLPAWLHTNHAIFVGLVQGVPRNFEAMRQCTKACDDIAPPDILMTALAGMASALDIGTIVGVDDITTISRNSLVSSAASFNYAVFWERYGACISQQRHHVMLVPFPEKPIQQIQAKHRGRTLNKRAFKAAVFDSASSVMHYRIRRPEDVAQDMESDRLRQLA